MPDARLQRTRDSYDEQPQWRRPSDNAAEQLRREQRRRVQQGLARYIGAAMAHTVCDLFMN